MMAAEVAKNEQWKPHVNPWLIAATVALAAFMEVLDTSIANVALPHIAGDLGASTSQGTWVLTSYLVSNAIILPVGAWASSVIGRKNFFLLQTWSFASLARTRNGDRERSKARC
jgi:MFS transporter, DHA2 family, multidrug resistance protein